MKTWFERHQVRAGNIISYMTWPARVVMATLKVPNMKIVYKSGHVERLYFATLSRQGSSWEWSNYQCGKRPIVRGCAKILKEIR